MSIVKQSNHIGIHSCSDNYELKSFEKLFNCDGCKMKGFGQRYLCNLCGHELHRECRFPQPTISHEHFAASIFKFREEPFTRIGKNNRKEYSKCCDACGKEICGFSYHCREDNLDLHICCRNLEKKLCINETVFNLHTKSSSKCVWCKKRKISDGNRDVPGWKYQSTCKNKYNFHVYCMVEMMHEACMKNGEMGLEKVELKKLAKYRRDRGSGSGKIFDTIKCLLKIILSALLGDPTLLISNVFVELVSCGFQ